MNERKDIDADYSKVELRILAEMGVGTPSALRDTHVDTAADIAGVTPDKVTEKMRRDAKAINFGSIYGASTSK